MTSPAGTVLRDVSISLGALIRERVYLETPGDVDVEYFSPSMEDPTKQGRRPLILVYLYSISDNPYLRNSPSTIVRTQTGFARRAAPVVVDLLYMFVSYAQNVEIELILVDELKRLFADVPVLQGDALKGALRATGNESLGIVPDNLSLEQIHRIWAGFPNKPVRLSLYYTITPVRIPRATEAPVDRVLEVATSLTARGPGEPAKDGAP
ncbi:DUF4255 domain-containing protein [Sorangium sp. So ce726]|uniref:DUF4255 domain-containing protein n=1 Tax=Sorangium sp. So ce726 TaxID=3133319 RepID=UPI003F61B897